jgi:nucleotide-binding universal stress UspA family protein
MSLRDLLVVLDGAPSSAVRLAVAIDLAHRHDAHVSGLCPLELLLPADLGFALSGAAEGFALQAAVNEIDASAAERADSIEAAFREQLRRNDLKGDWQLLKTRLVGAAIARHARTADLVVLGQVDPDERLLPYAPARALIDDVLLTSGRPVLLVPYVGRFDTLGTNVLVGWNGTREAARAVHDALPLIDTGARVTILEVQRPGSAKEGESSGVEISEHLARHGLKVSATRTVADSSISDADALLSYAADLPADLLVVGGYGHSRMRELVLGGVTRGLLQHMTLPVLMSH